MSNLTTPNERSNAIMEMIADRASYYRMNPNRFAEDYLNIKLFLFQKILLMMMSVSTHFMYLAARGQGKTHIAAVFCVIRAILYPGTKIIIAAGQRSQSNQILEKIRDILMPNSVNLRSEIKDLNINQAKGEIIFWNTSTIKVVSANDYARGNRANIIIADEFRMIPLSVINTVLKKFKSDDRTPPCLEKPEYKHLKGKERNKEIYLSSAWLKSHWCFNKFQTFCSNLFDRSKKYFVAGLPYQIAIQEGFLNPDQVADDMTEADFSEISWLMEMDCMFYGEGEGSFFTYTDISKNMVIEKAMFPPEVSQYANNARQLEIPDLAKKERRILSADIALLASKKSNNDAAALFVNSAIPNNSGKYIANMVYTENHEGLRTDVLALKIRRLFDVYKCTDLVIDGKGIGLPVLDLLLNEIVDTENGIIYPALNCINNPDYAERCTDKKAPKCIWVILPSATFNTEMYLTLRDGFKQNKIRLLISDMEIDDVLKDYVRGFGGVGGKGMDIDKRQLFKLPYIHTRILLEELTMLQHEAKGTNIKVYEKSGMRKDRVSSIGYNYWVMLQIEAKNQHKSKNNTGESIIVKYKQPSIRSV